MKKQLLLLACFLTPALALNGCSTANKQQSAILLSQQSSEALSKNDTDDLFDEIDLNDSFSKEQAALITLSGDSVQISGAGAKAEDQTITIQAPGDYLLEGSLSDGRIIVNTDGVVRLLLHGVSITNTSSYAPIEIQKSERTILTLVENTENIISDSGRAYFFTDEEKEEPDAAIFSKSDLTINGTGTLTVTANYKNAIKSKDILKIVSGTLLVSAANHGIVGRDILAVKNGNITITSGGDGMKTTNADDPEKGFAVFLDGTYTIDAQGDGIQAETALTISGGTYQITTGGGSEQVQLKQSSASMGRGGGGRPFGEPGEGNGMPFPNGDTGAMPKQNADLQPDSDAPADMNASSDTKPRGSLQNLEDNSPVQPSSNTLADANTSSDTKPRGSLQNLEDNSPVQPSSDTLADANTSSDTKPRGSLKNLEDNSPVQPSPDALADMNASDTISDGSYKGLKAGTELLISGGEFTIDAKDDAVHTNANAVISGGTLTLSTGDDAIHADELLTISSGTISVLKSYEGLEGTNVLISGGKISVISSDDGINAAGGSDGETAGPMGQDRFRQASASSADITISGGSISIDAQGDGIDSNGTITMTGGVLWINGPTASGNGAIDYEREFTITGGILIASGGSGMAQTPSSSSTQKIVALTLAKQQDANTIIRLCSSNGEVISAFAPTKEFSSVILSLPELAEGEYLITVGGSMDTSPIDGFYTDGTFVLEDGQEFSFTVTDTVTNAGDGKTGGMGQHSQGLKTPRP